MLIPLEDTSVEPMTESQFIRDPIVKKAIQNHLQCQQDQPDQQKTGPPKIAAERLAHDLSVALGLGFQLGSIGLQVTDIGRRQGSAQDEIPKEIRDKIYHETRSEPLPLAGIRSFDIDCSRLRRL